MVENFNEPHPDTWNEYDDGMDLSNYDFNNDGLAQPCDDANKIKLAYQLCSIGNKGCIDYLMTSKLRSGKIYMMSLMRTLSE